MAQAAHKADNLKLKVAAVAAATATAAIADAAAARAYQEPETTQAYDTTAGLGESTAEDSPWAGPWQPEAPNLNAPPTLTARASVEPAPMTESPHSRRVGWQPPRRALSGTCPASDSEWNCHSVGCPSSLNNARVEDGTTCTVDPSNELQSTTTGYLLVGSRY